MDAGLASPTVHPLLTRLLVIRGSVAVGPPRVLLGDQAFRVSEPEKRNLRWEAGQFRAGRLWHRWDYPHVLGSSEFDERQEVFARYLTDNWRAFRGEQHRWFSIADARTEMSVYSMSAT